MKESKKRDKYLSSKSIYKGLIRFLLFRDGELTAKQLQVKTGLKRQSCYNYLKEMKNEGKVGVRYEKVENKPQVQEAYYSIIYESLAKDHDNLSERIRVESNDLEKMLRRIRLSIESNIGALLEITTGFNRMTLQEAANYVRRDPWGFYGFTTLLTDKEYNELISEFKSMFDRLNKKWEEEKEENAHSGNVFMFTFYKTIPE